MYVCRHVHKFFQSNEIYLKLTQNSCDCKWTASKHGKQRVTHSPGTQVDVQLSLGGWQAQGEGHIKESYLAPERGEVGVKGALLAKVYAPRGVGATREVVGLTH